MNYKEETFLPISSIKFTFLCVASSNSEKFLIYFEKNNVLYNQVKVIQQ